MSTIAGAPPLARASGRAARRARGRTRTARWGATLRLARRELTRAKGRALLVVALIAVPVGAMVFAEVMIRSANLTTRQRALVGLGSVADARLDIFGSDASADTSSGADALADVEHTDVTEIYFGRMKLGEKFRYVSLQVADLANPLLRGAYDLTAGAAPLTADEAALSQDAARSYHVSVGDKISLRRSGQTWTVSGIYRSSDQIDTTAVVIRRSPPGDFPNRQIRRFVKAPSTRLAALPQSVGNIVARDRAATPSWQALDDKGLVAVLGLYTVGTVALAIVGVVISAAFAAGARRQLRTLGLAAASGGSPGDVRRIVVAQGSITGVLGVVAGFCIGAIGVAAMAPRLDRLIGFVLPGLHTRIVDLVIVAGLAISTATAAAVVPAVGAGRAPVLVALAGRRPLAPLRNSVPIVGVVLFAVGLVGLGATARANPSDSAQSLVEYAVAVLAILLGAVLSTPWIIGRLDRAAPHLRGPARLAARSMTRSRGRTGPISSAILVTVGAAAFVATTQAAQFVSRSGTSADRNLVSFTTNSFSAEDQLTRSSVPADAVERARAIIGGSAPYGYTFLRDPASATSTSAWTPLGGGSTTAPPDTRDGAGTFVASDRASLAAMGAPASAITAWEQGAVLVLGPGLVRDGRLAIARVELATTRGAPPVSAAPPAETRSAAAVALPPLVVDGRYQGAQFCDGSACRAIAAPPLVVLPESVATSLGLAPTQSTVITRSARPLTASQRERLRQLRSDLNDEAQVTVDRGGPDVRVVVEFADDPPPNRLFQLMLLLAATGAALGVTAIGLALSAAEGRADDATLLALGAPPRLRRSLRAWEALMTSGIGSMLGVVLGSVAGTVYAVQHHRSSGAGTDLRFPWPTALGLGVGLPVVAAIVFWLATWPRRSVLLRDD